LLTPEGTLFLGWSPCKSAAEFDVTVWT